MTAQSSAIKAGTFYKFLPYYLNKLRYLRPQFIMCSIFSLLSYPFMAAAFIGVCETVKIFSDADDYSEYIAIAQENSAYSNAQSIFIMSIVIAVICCIGLFVFTLVTTFRAYRYLYNKTAVDMDYALPVNHSTRFFGDLAAVATTSLLPHLIGILLALILSLFFDTSAFAVNIEAVNTVISSIVQLAFTGFFSCVMLVGITVLMLSFCGRTAEAYIYTILVNFAVPVIHTLGIYLVESGVYGGGATLSESLSSIYAITSTSPLGMIFTSFYTFLSVMFAGSEGPLVPILKAEYFIPAIIITLVYFVGAYFLIKHRRTERVGMPYVYKAMNLIVPGIIIFAVTMPICSVIFSAARQNNTVNSYTPSIPGWITGMAISTFIIYTIMELIAGRNFRRFHISVAKWAGTLAVSVGISAVLAFSNGFGLAYYIPAESSINSVSVLYQDSSNDLLVYRFEADADDTELIELATELHDEVPKQDPGDLSYFCQISFQYTMKDGTALYRQYYLSETMAADLINKMVTPETWISYEYSGLFENIDKGYKIINVTDSTDYSTEAFYTPDSEKLLQAIKDDCAKVNYEFTADKSSWYCVILTAELVKSNERQIINSYSSFYVYDWMENTIAVLKEAGFDFDSQAALLAASNR